MTSDKDKKGRHFTNAANFYLTAQHKPDWGAENKGVYERIKDFQMSPLATIDRDVANWFKKKCDTLCGMGRLHGEEAYQPTTSHGALLYEAGGRREEGAQETGIFILLELIRILITT